MASYLPFNHRNTPDTNGYTNETFEEGTVGLDMTLSLFEGFSRIHQVRFRKMNKERSEWALKNKRNELAYQVTDAYYKLILERKLLNLALEQSRLSERYLKQTEAFVELGLKSASDLQEVKARREGDIYRYKSRENTCRLALLHLEQLMNFQPGDTLVIQDTIVEANQLPLLSVPSTETLYTQSLEILPVMRMIDLLISVFQLMEARNRFISAKAELVRVRLQVEMMRKLEKYYREGTFL